MTSVFGSLGGIFGSIASALGSAIFCSTFSKQSPVNMNLGLVGPTSQAVPLYINTAAGNNEQLITNFKVNFRANGVSVPAIENSIVSTNLTPTNISFPGLLASVSDLDAYTRTNPTLAIPTIFAWAIIVVRQDPTLPAPDYNLPQIQFDFSMLSSKLVQNPPPAYANLTNKPNCILFADYSILYGHQTYRDFQFGFKDEQYPGSVRLGPGDWLQLNTFGSNNFDVPEYGTAGIWARLCGLVSLETLPPVETKDEGNLTLNAKDSIYKLFNRRGGA